MVIRGRLIVHAPAEGESGELRRQLQAALAAAETAQALAAEASSTAAGGSVAAKAADITTAERPEGAEPLQAAQLGQIQTLSSEVASFLTTRYGCVYR